MWVCGQWSVGLLRVLSNSQVVYHWAKGMPFKDTSC